MFNKQLGVSFVCLNFLCIARIWTFFASFGFSAVSHMYDVDSLFPILVQSKSLESLCKVERAILKSVRIEINN